MEATAGRARGGGVTLAGLARTLATAGGVAAVTIGLVVTAPGLVLGDAGAHLAGGFAALADVAVQAAQVDWTAQADRVVEAGWAAAREWSHGWCPEAGAADA